LIKPSGKNRMVRRLSEPGRLGGEGLCVRRLRVVDCKAARRWGVMDKEGQQQRVGVCCSQQGTARLRHRLVRVLRRLEGEWRDGQASMRVR